MTQLKVTREEQNISEKIGNGDTTIFRSQAEFDGSEVTGTKTSLTGKYIARIRHTPESEEGRYHERLKHLFSSGSSKADEKET